MGKDNKSFHVKPLAGHVVVRPHEQAKIGNMQTADTISSQDSTGVVVAVGADWRFFEGGKEIEVICPVKIGDKIVYPNMGVQMIRDFKTGELLYMPHFHFDPTKSQILAIIE